MDEPTVLRETKIGQKGFMKEDVMAYLDELNSKIVSLEDELKKAKETGPATDPQELIKTRNQMENLQEKLNNSNNALRAAKKENEELKKRIEDDQKLINQLKAGGPGASAAAAQANAQTAAALEAAKKEIDSLRNQLKAAETKAAAGGGNAAQANAQSAAALEAAKKEIDNLRSQLKAAEANAAKGGAPAVNPNDNAKYEQYKEIITKEFFPKRGEGKMRFSVCKKAVKDFKALDPDPVLLCDLMLYIPECASKVANGWGDLWESFYDSAYNNFVIALKEISKCDLKAHFQKRVDKILDNCQSSGYGFGDAMEDAYIENWVEG